MALAARPKVRNHDLAVGEIRIAAAVAGEEGRADAADGISRLHVAGGGEIALGGR